MKSTVKYLGALGLLAIGFAAGATWQQSRRQAFTEDAVAKEIQLLEKYKAVPNCEQLKAASNGCGEEHARGAVVHWRRMDGNGRITRVVVADDLTVAYDEVNNPCKPDDAP